MGRTKTFDENAAIEKAMYVFWQKGYENTSLKDLLEQMKILNGSFYNVYGSKKNLFLKVMENYEKRFFEKFAVLEALDVPIKQKFLIFYDHVAGQGKDNNDCQGCLIFDHIRSNTVTDPDVEKFLRRAISRLEDTFRTELDKAKKKGELPETADSRLLAGLLVLYMRGFIEMAAFEYSDAKVRAQTELFLTSLGFQ